MWITILVMAIAVTLESFRIGMTVLMPNLTFNVVAIALAEIPLLAYLIAPDGTRVLMAALHDWILARTRREVAALLAAVGCKLLLASGHCGSAIDRKLT